MISWLDIYNEGAWSTSFLAPSRLCSSFHVYHLKQMAASTRASDSTRLKILDAGCGDCGNSQFLLECGYEVYGVDIHRSDRIVEISLGPHKSSFCFIESDLGSVPLPDHYFDAILCDGVLYYNSLDSFICQLREMRRLLKLTGSVFRFSVKEVSDQLFFGTKNTPSVDFIETTCNSGWEKGLPILGFSKDYLLQILNDIFYGGHITIGFDFFHYASDNFSSGHRFLVVTVKFD